MTIIPKLTILIKALNEAQHIAACLDTACKEAQQLKGEVILVDSLSTDTTVALAKQYPIRIIQFVNKADCGCGSAVQLGYQYARGEFIYILDADMVLQPGFLALALETLNAEATLAGVGGKLLDSQIVTIADKKRVQHSGQLHQAVDVNELDGGGLYRRSAIEQVGYLANRWLAAYEEAELGMRLRAAGWRLKRLPHVSVLHTGHQENNWQMLRRQWQNRRAQAGGLLLRGAFGKPWFWLACRKQWHWLTALGLHTSAGLLSLLSPLVGVATLPGFIFLEFILWLITVSGLAFIKHNLSAALVSIVLWHYSLAAALHSLSLKVRDPSIVILGHVVQ